MTVPMDLLLIAGIFGFYVFDSVILLYSNEILISEHNGRFSVSVGSNFQISGRYLYLPGLHTPHHGLFKGIWSWSDTGSNKEFVPGLLHFLDALALLKRGCLLLGVLLLLLLPVLLLASASPLALLVVLGSIYLSIAVMVYSCWTHRRALELSGRDVAILAVEAFFCPPFSINFVRKVCQKRLLRQDALMLAERLVPPEQLLPLLVAVEGRVQICIDFEDESSALYEEMIRFRSRVQERQP